MGGGQGRAHGEGMGRGGERYMQVRLLAFSLKCRTFSCPWDRASVDGERPSADRFQPLKCVIETFSSFVLE